VRELDDKNNLDCAARAKIATFAENAFSVSITAMAFRDSALLNLTKASILGAIVCHLGRANSLFCDRLDSGEIAYVIKQCATDAGEIYVKLKFYRFRGPEKMLIISAHPNRRW
jgi:hypothetical protein